MARAFPLLLRPTSGNGRKLLAGVDVDLLGFFERMADRLIDCISAARKLSACAPIC